MIPRARLRGPLLRPSPPPPINLFTPSPLVLAFRLLSLRNREEGLPHGPCQTLFRIFLLFAVWRGFPVVIKEDESPPA